MGITEEDLNEACEIVGATLNEAAPEASHYGHPPSLKGTKSVLPNVVFGLLAGGVAGFAVGLLAYLLTGGLR